MAAREHGRHLPSRELAFEASIANAPDVID